MKHLLSIFIVLALMGLGGIGHGQEQPLSLAECIRLAVQNNPTLLQSELALARDKIRLRQSRYELLPSLNGSAGHNWSQGRNIDPSSNQYIEQNSSFGQQSLSAALPIFDGFRTLHDIRMKARAREAGKMEQESRVRELRLDVTEAYLRVLMADDMRKQAEIRLDVTNEQLRRAEIMHREGAFAPGDYYDLRGQLKVDQNAIEDGKNAQNTARSRLAGLLNIAPGELPPLESMEHVEIPAERPDAATLFAQARTAIPDIRALDWRVREAESGIKAARADLWPSLSLSGGLNSNYSSASGRGFADQMRGNLGRYVALGLNVPIFNKFRVRSQVKMARLELENARYARDIRLNRLREETANLSANLRSLRENIKNLQAQEADFAESFRIAKVHFETGNSNSVLFLSAKARLDNARSQLLVKRYEWLLQKYVEDAMTDDKMANEDAVPIGRFNYQMPKYMTKISNSL